MGNCSCAACDQACPAPPVDASIGFFDGFDGGLVAIVYGVLIAFSIVFQIARYAIQKKYNKDEEVSDEVEEQQDTGENNPYTSQKRGGGHRDKINNSEVSSFANNSQLIAAQPRLIETGHSTSNISPLYNN